MCQLALKSRLGRAVAIRCDQRGFTYHVDVASVRSGGQIPGPVIYGEART
jgi:hypothetical protein